MFEQKFDTHKVSLHLVVHERFPLISWLNYSFCICHTMLKLNWSNSITTKWKCFSPPSSKQIFSDGDEIKRRQWLILRIEWHKSIKISKVCVIMRLTLIMFRLTLPGNSLLIFTIYVDNFIIPPQICSLKHALFVIKCCFSSVCVFPSHPQFMSQFVMLYESSNLVSFVRVGEEKFVILATFPGSAYFSISFLSSSPTLRFRSSQGRVSIK